MYRKIIQAIKRIPSAFINTIRNGNIVDNVTMGKYVKLYPKYILINVKINDYSYIQANSNVRNTKVGKFCSIGPNFICGLAYHPIDGISTSPFFYSTKKQCGATLSKVDKVEEFSDVVIGNDVFIGANVSIIGGVTIKNGAVIVAGSVVTKDIPPYAIAAGVPAKVIKFRFSMSIIKKLEEMEWWDYSEEKLKLVEKHQFDMPAFLENNKD